MARKSIKGYAEKNYYDNTRFSGGIVATNDPLNEGYFKHLVNFDISDMGQSLTPRKGFLTTTCKDEEDNIVTFSDKTVYYYDANIGKWIFIDFGNPDNIPNGDDILTLPKVYLITFDLDNNYIKDAHKVLNIDTPNIFSEVEIDNNLAQLMKDEYAINTYVCKINDTLTTFMYRENSSEYEDANFPEDTLIIRTLNTDDIVDYVDTSRRNLASFKSIIPDPIQIVYEDGKQPDGFVQQFPMIYVRNTEGKYLINTTYAIEGLTIYPNFYLKKFENNKYDYEGEKIDKYKWAYAYDVITTASIYEMTEGVLEDINYIYRSDVYDLDNNLIIGYFISDINIHASYINEVNTHIPYTDFDGNSYTYGHVYYKDVKEYKDVLKESSVLDDGNLYNHQYNQAYTYVLYIVPMHSKDTEGNPTIDRVYPASMFNSDNPMTRSIWYSDIDYIYPSYTSAIGIAPYVLDTVGLWKPENIGNWYDKYEDKLYPLTKDDLFKNGIILSDVNEITQQYKYATDAYAALRNWWSIFSIGNRFNIDIDISTQLRSELNAVNTQYYSIEYFLEKLETVIDAIPRQPSNSLSGKDTVGFYLIPLSEVKEYSKGKEFSKISQTILHSDIVPIQNKPMSFEELSESLKDKDIRKIIYKVFDRVSYIMTPKFEPTVACRIEELQKLFPGISERSQEYYVYTSYESKPNKWLYHSEYKEEPNPLVDDSYTNDYSDIINARTDSMLNLFISINSIKNNLYDSTLTYLPNIKRYGPGYTPPIGEINIGIFSREEKNLFGCITQGDSTLLNAYLDETSSAYKDLKEKNFFENGLNIIMYLMKIPNREWLKKEYPAYSNYTRDYFTNTTSLKQTRIITLDTRKPTTYVEYLTEEPQMIKESKDYFVFNSSLGDHLVLWKDNRIFISKENKQYYFTEDYSFTYPEKIVKAIQYKDMVLVFTTQNLYAVYLTEYVTSVQNGTDEEGNPRYLQQTTYVFATLPVLYNLMVDERYKDAIQVYNQMVLFYSADGQMFLIKPTAAIDSNTRFSIQYFNKSANDILLNYKDYMQERLKIYGVDKIIDDVEIKVSASINYIKIFYTAKDIMTYVLIYDILNNRYYVYDTLMFTKVNSLQYIPSGELYIVEDDNKLYFTLPYNNVYEIDNNVDIGYKDNFYKNSIRTELDTGTINLNNHLKKRFKDLHVIYKNLNSTDLEFALEVFVDDVPIIPYIDDTLEVRDIAGAKTLVVTEYNKVINFLEGCESVTGEVDKLINVFKERLKVEESAQAINFLESNTALFNFVDYTSNKIITHRTHIVSRGKTIRSKLYFASKGKYKIQGFGLIYKEHTV